MLPLLRGPDFVDSRQGSARWTLWLTLLLAAAWTLACSEDSDPAREPVALSGAAASTEAPTDTDEVVFFGSTGAVGSAAANDPAGAAPSRRAVRLVPREAVPPPAPEPQQPALDSDQAVALDADREARANEAIREAAKSESGADADPSGPLRVDSDAYALSRE